MTGMVFVSAIRIERTWGLGRKYKNQILAYDELPEGEVILPNPTFDGALGMNIDILHS